MPAGSIQTPSPHRIRRAGGVFIAVQALVALTLLAMPRTWHVEAVLLAEAHLRMPALANPDRGRPQAGEAPGWAAADLVLSQRNLLAIIQETNLLSRWEVDRGPVMRAVDRLRSARGPIPTVDERRDQLVEILRKRLYVKALPEGTVAIGIDWPNARTAFVLVEAAQQKFLETRRAREVRPVDEVIAILERRAAESGDSVTAARAELVREEALLPPALRGEARRTLPVLRTASPTAADPLAEALASARADLDRLETSRAARRKDAEARLSTLRTVYSDRHPSVLAAQDAIASWDEPDPQEGALRRRIRALEAGVLREANQATADDATGEAEAGPGEEEGTRRPLVAAGLRGSAQGDPRIPGVRPRVAIALDGGTRVDADGVLLRSGSSRAGSADDLQVPAIRDRRADPPGLVAARGRLHIVALEHERLLRRIEAARIEADVVRAAFAYRYLIVVPAEVPVEPVRPRRLVVILGGILCGLVLGAFAFLTTSPAYLPGRVALPFSLSGRRWVTAAAGGVAVATIVLLATMTNPLIAVAPTLLAAAAWWLVTAPLRQTALVLLFSMLVLDAPGDSSGKWQSPWHLLGHLLNSNLNLTLPVPALRFAGVDAIFALLAAVAVGRRMAGRDIDTSGAWPAPAPLVGSVFLSLGAMAVLVVTGMAQGGDFGQVLWQCHVPAMLLAMVLLFLAALRGPQDLAPLARTVVAAALVKACLAVWVRTTVALPLEALPTATSHADSMLFAGATCLLVVMAVESPGRRTVGRLLLLSPILTAGMVANNRRLVWVEIVAALMVVYFMLPRSRAKRTIQRGLVLAAPVLLLYVVVGWNSGSPIFAPVAKIRSVVDSKSDRSAEERDVENYNLIKNLQDHPFLGMGFGREYVQYTRGDDISHLFAQWRFIPHNSVLGLLAFGGVLGFTALFAFLTVGLFLAARAYRATADPSLRSACLVVISVAVVFLIQAYGDMAIVSWTGVFLLAPALAAAGKLATATGAWRQAARPSPVPGPSVTALNPLPSPSNVPSAPTP
jgi:hypothetical protein